MNSFYKNYHKIISKVLLVTILCLAIYIIIKYLLPFLLPFAVAFILALINEPFIRFLSKHTRLSRKICAVLSLVLTLSIMAVLVTLGILKIYNELIVLKGNVNNYVTDFSNVYSDFTKQISSIYNALPDAITKALDAQVVDMAPKIESIVSGTAKYIIDTISSVPKVAIFIIVTILSTYFMSSSRLEIRAFMYKQMPQKWADEFRGIKKDTFHSLIGYFKALVFLATISFIEVLIVLSIFRVDYVVIMALLVGMADLVPFFGNALVYIPWIAINLFTGNTDMVILLAALWGGGFIIRQFLEPKIIGRQIGIHPLVTLMSIYVGLSLFGVVGVFVGPISLIIIKSLQSAGLFTLWTE